MESIIREKIKAYLTLKGITLNRIATETGYPQATLQKQISKDVTISVKTLMVILGYCKDLSTEWLLRDTGSMLISENTGKTYNITRQVGNGNIAGDGNEIAGKEDLLKMALEQNQQLINALLGGK